MRAGLDVTNEAKLALVIVLARERISSVAPAYEPLDDAHRHRHQHQHPAAPSDTDTAEDPESANALEAEAARESELQTSAIPVLASSSRTPNPASTSMSTHRESSSGASAAANIAVGAAATADATEPADVEMKAEEEEALHPRQDSEDRPAGVSSEPAVPQATPSTTRDAEVVREQAISTMSNLAMAILKSLKGSASTDKASPKPASSAGVPKSTSALSAPADVDYRGASSIDRSSSTPSANAEAVVAQYVRTLVSQQLSTSTSNLAASPSASAGARTSTLPPSASESAYLTPKRMASSPSASSPAGGTPKVKTLQSPADSTPLSEHKQRHGSSRWDQRDHSTPEDADSKHSPSGATSIPVLLQSGMKRTAFQDESEWPADSHSPDTPIVKAARQESVRTPLLPPAPASLVSPPLASPSPAGGSPMLPKDFSTALPPPRFMQLTSGPQWAGVSVQSPPPSHPVPFPISNFGVQTAAFAPIVPLVNPSSAPPPRLPLLFTATSPTSSAAAVSPTSGVSFTIHPTRLQWL